MMVMVTPVVTGMVVVMVMLVVVMVMLVGDVGGVGDGDVGWCIVFTSYASLYLLFNLLLYFIVLYCIYQLCFSL